MLPTVEDIQRTQVVDTHQKIIEVHSRLAEINAAINKAEGQSKAKNVSVPSQPVQKSDWTKIYADADNFAKMDSLLQEKSNMETSMEALMNKQEVFNHVHDHSKERAFFELSEGEKFIHCENYRKIGNALFKEGNYERAADRYMVAIAYYEYCFPDSEGGQRQCDHAKLSALCNVALCHTRLGRYRQAIVSAKQVLQCEGCDSVHTAKAYYRMAQAYRLLDEYE